jgi:hypothetical protein
MPACSSLDLVIEIPWPDADASVETSDRTLPPSSATLDRVIFPRDEESPPVSAIHLAARLLQPPAAERPIAVHTQLQASQFEWASALRVAPSVAGIVLAARFLAFRRGAKRTAPGDAVAAMVLACSASFADAFGNGTPVAVAFEHHRRHAMTTTSPADRDIVWLLAMFGPHIHPSRLRGVIPELRTLLGPGTLHHLSAFTEANAFTAHVLRRILPGTLIETALADRDSRRLVTDVLHGPHIEDVWAFLLRVFRATLAHVDGIDGYADQVLADAGIAKPPAAAEGERVSSSRPPQDVVRRASVRERADRATIAMTRLLPHHPHLVSLLVGKAALLGTELPPSPILLSGGSAAARRTVLRTLARASDAAFVLVHASSIAGYADAPSGATILLSSTESIDFPLHLPTAAGSIVVIDGCDALLTHEDFDTDAQRTQRLGAQRILAHLLAHGVPTSMQATLWPQSPVFFICCTDDEVNLRAWHSGRGVLPALRDQLGDRVQLPDRPSIALMVELLRPIFAPRKLHPRLGFAASLLPDALEVPEATLAVAARLASAHRGTVADARRVIETAARRIVMSRAHGESASRVAVTPDDLSASDLEE